MPEVSEKILRKGKLKHAIKENGQSDGRSECNGIATQGKKRRNQQNQADRSKRDGNSERDRGAESKFPARLHRLFKSFEEANQGDNCEQNNAVEMCCAKKTISDERVPGQPDGGLFIKQPKNERDGE